MDLLRADQQRPADPPLHRLGQGVPAGQGGCEGEGRLLIRVAAVIGHPIGQSLSPTIFAAAFEATGLDWQYLAFDVDPALLPDAVAGVRGLGLAGINVTTPHKEPIVELVDELTPRAQALRAVNCVTPVSGRLVGDSTDGDGFVASLHHVGVELGGRRLVVLGAGGAARSIVAAAADAGAADVAVVNRTPARAHEAARLAGPVGRVADAAELADFDIVVNATTVGFGDPSASPVPTDALAAGQVAVDAVYHPLRTRFLDDAAARGATTFDGLGMLVGQAAIAFERWTGEAAPVDAMRAAVQAVLPG